MAVTIRTFVTSEPDTADAVADLRRQLAGSSAPNFIFAFYSSRYDDVLLHRMLQDVAPGVPVLGGSSGHGVMSRAGLGADLSMGLLTIVDDDGLFGVAASPIGADPAADAARTIHAALANAGASGELPELVWIYQAPGHEEAVLAGLRSVVGDRCPIVGGSAAADIAVLRNNASVDSGGGWRQLSATGPMTDGLVAAVLFPSGGVSVSYQSGFEPMGTSGVVTDLGADEAQTAADSSRRVLTIDGEPAAEVYDRWMGGVLPDETLAQGGPIALTSAWFPLGVVAGTINDLTYFRLVHVDSVTEDGGLRTFAAVAKGSRVYPMRGSRSSLISRAGRVATSAMSMLEGDGGQPAGALMVYCVGCRLAVGDEIDEVATSARSGFGAVPFLGCFTGGEQGPVLVENVHANLMISAVVFGR